LVIAFKLNVMTTTPKVFIVVIMTATIGTGIYEAHSYSKLRDQFLTLQHRHTPLTAQLRQLQRENEDTTNRLMSLLKKNKTLKAARNLTELLKLRGEVTQLKTARTHQETSSTESAAKSWLNRVEQLKQYIAQHPDETIPEFQFLTDQAWLTVVEPSNTMSDSEHPEDYFRRAAVSLSFQAQDRFGTFISTALQKYANASNGQFPADLAQLQPYCDANVAAMLQALYAIKPVTILSKNQIKEQNLKTGWVVTRKKRACANSTSRVAYFADGFSWWQSPIGSDDL
jgi:cell division protein FtsL